MIFSKENYFPALLFHEIIVGKCSTTLQNCFKVLHCRLSSDFCHQSVVSQQRVWSATVTGLLLLLQSDCCDSCTSAPLSTNDTSYVRTYLAGYAASVFASQFCTTAILFDICWVIRCVSDFRLLSFAVRFKRVIYSWDWHDYFGRISRGILFASNDEGKMSTLENPKFQFVINAATKTFVTLSLVTLLLTGG